MLKAVPKSWFSWGFTVLDGAQPIANIDISCWSEKGTLLVLGLPYKVYREGMMSGTFLLESDGTILARAVKPSAFSRSFIVEHAGRKLALRSTFFGRYRLLEGDREIGSISPETICFRRANVNLPEDLPLPVRLFILWLVILLWKRDSDAAASTAAFVAVVAAC